jgi:uncharacterized membrane protein YqjE
MADESPHISAQRSRSTKVSDGDSAVSLLRRLVDEVSTLFRQEIALASAELSRSLSSVKAGVGSIAMGGAVAFAGFLVLLEALVLGLSERLAPWLAALIVGVVVAIIGYIMLHTGRKRLEPAVLKPRHTQESLRRDQELLERRAK